MQHLRYSDRCLSHLVDTFPPLSTEEVDALDEQDRVFTVEQRALGWGPKKALLLAVRVLVCPHWGVQRVQSKLVTRQQIRPFGRLGPKAG